MFFYLAQFFHYPEHYPSTEQMLRVEIWQLFWRFQPNGKILIGILDLRNLIVEQEIFLEFFLNQDLPVHRWSWIPIWSSMMIHLKSHCLLGTPRGQDPLKN